ncbi:MAG: SusD/RagB family nutrient-binding outer membrane lipoprotein [Chlorobi bacterium]|nr:SusD/RagB family nutrient-binding outer membrane lipoprotein [Chlorobiota bacterium]
MKHIFLKSILILLVLFSAVSCQDELEELYQDPDGFSKEQADKTGGVSVIAGFFTSQLTRGFFLRGDYGSVYHQIRSGDRIMGTGIELYYTTPSYGVSYTLKDVEHDWGTRGFNYSVFWRINGDWIKQVLWAQREYNLMNEDERSTLDELFMNLLHALKGYGYQRAIDLYDVVPYIETGSAGALEGDKAKYLGQKEIYPKIIEELKEVDDYLATVQLSNQEQTIFTNQDVLFNGNLLMWRKYINSLRVRFAMNVSEVMPDLTSSVLNDLTGKPLFEDWNEDAGIADIQIVEPYLLQVSLGITRSFRERSDDCRAPKKFIQDVMHCMPDDSVKIIDGVELHYFITDNSEEGLENGTVDPRVTYIFSKDILGRYIGSGNNWDDWEDPNSYFSKLCRAYYINDPIMYDSEVTTFTYGPNNEWTITLSDEAANGSFLDRDAFLLDAVRKRLGQYNDINWIVGTDRNMMSEYNVRPQFNFDLRYPTLHAVETHLALAEAAVRGFGTINGSAREHYKRAIEISCRYWYDLNVNNQYSKQTVPAFPSNMDESRIERDRAEKEYDASAYAEYAATLFDSMSPKEKVQAIYDQLHLHYNLMNFEVPFTAARRLIKYLGTCPSTPYEVFTWKERMTYPGSIQASDPDNWVIISPLNDPGLPVWFTGRTTKWKNTLE